MKEKLDALASAWEKEAKTTEEWHHKMDYEKKKLKEHLQVTQAEFNVNFDHGNTWRVSTKRCGAYISDLHAALYTTLEITKVQFLMFGYHINLKVLDGTTTIDKAEWDTKRKQATVTRAQREKKMANQTSRLVEQLAQASNDQSCQIQSSQHTFEKGNLNTSIKEQNANSTNEQNAKSSA